MARWFSCCFLSFLCIFQQLQVCYTEPLTLTILCSTASLMGIIDFIWNKLDGHSIVSESFTFHSIEEKMGDATQIVDIISNANKKQIVKKIIREIMLESFKIENWYRQMKSYNETYNDQIAYDLIIPQAKTRILNKQDGPLYHLNIIFSNFIFMDVLRSLENVVNKGFINTCSTSDVQKSVQQMYLQLYQSVTEVATKALLTVMISAEFLRKYEPSSSYHEDLSYIKESVQKKHEKLILIFKHYFEKASREVWRCDPKILIENENYVQLNVFKKRLTVLDVFDPKLGRQCNYANPLKDKTVDCWEYRGKIYSGIEQIDDRNTTYRTCSYLQHCAGNLWDCANSLQMAYVEGLRIPFLPRANDTKMSYAARIVRLPGNRDYQPVDYGHKEDFRSDPLYQDDFWMIELTKYQTICACTCDSSAESYSEPFISLQGAFSNTTDNRVVTGVRFVKSNRTIRIEVEEGKLAYIGTIVANSTRWITTESYPEPTEDDLKNYRVHKLKWTGNRKIALNDLEGNDNSVLVGLKFEVDEENPNLGIYLRIYTMEFDYLTGKLLNKTSEITKPADGNIDQDNLDNPVKSDESSVAISETNKFVTFTTTGLREDMGQHVIPFFDTQEVKTSVPVPMSGAGLYYKRSSSGLHGGFLALKLFTYNFYPNYKNLENLFNNTKIDLDKLLLSS